MKHRVKIVLSLICCVFIILSSLMVAMGYFLKNTLLSVSFYDEVTLSPLYLSMLKDTISDGLSAQGNYSDIPLETLKEGLNDTKIKELLAFHFDNAVSYLADLHDYKAAVYPEDLFYQPLEAYIKVRAEKEGFTPATEQYTLLHEVAANSASLVSGHINLLNFDYFKKIPAAQKFRIFLYNFCKYYQTGWVFLLLSLTALIALNRGRIRRVLLYFFSSLWITGAVMAVPSVVLELSGITRRFSIGTAYLKYAVDTWLTQCNHFFMTWGIILFVISTTVLILRILVPHRHGRYVSGEEK